VAPAAPPAVTGLQEQPVDAPRYAGDGFRKPRLAEPGCIGSTMRLPRDVIGTDGETATVRFAVGADGQPSQYQFLSGPSDPRVATAIWSAVQQCQFVAGADASGRPTSIWLVVPIRFGSR
jgi:hypothetical protein